MKTPVLSVRCRTCGHAGEVVLDPETAETRRKAVDFLNDLKEEHHRATGHRAGPIMETR